jgi:hypothetical protein
MLKVMKCYKYLGMTPQTSGKVYVHYRKDTLLCGEHLGRNQVTAGNSNESLQFKYSVSFEVWVNNSLGVS